MFTGKYQRSEACAMQIIKNGDYEKSALLFVQGEDGEEHLYSLNRAQLESLYNVARKVVECDRDERRW
ncbi:hypothetical protein [uncultured Desulfovibrio sp.]|jgi:hypothetical protein|uniref:hypothetical protein n=1 Tax=uncultured Desulfovibrio sp. TaxID=167968 RepID=UPI00280648D3|nr:hypothetical protein [uncultured Desulfovibrio sp.]